MCRLRISSVGSNANRWFPATELEQFDKANVIAAEDGGEKPGTPVAFAFLPEIWELRRSPTGSQAALTKEILTPLRKSLKGVKTCIDGEMEGNHIGSGMELGFFRMKICVS